MDHIVWKVSSPPSIDNFPHLAILPFTYFCWTPLRCRQHFGGNIAPVLPLFYKQDFCIPHQAEIWVVNVLSKNTVKIQSYVLKRGTRKKTLWMKELLGKEHDCYKIHTLLTKSVSSYLLLDNIPIWIPAPPLLFLQKYLDHLLLWFFKDLNPLFMNKGVHTRWKIFVIMTWP